MTIARPSTIFALSSAARRTCIRTRPTQVRSTLGRRQYADNVDEAAQVANTTSKGPWIVTAGALMAGGVYYFLQPQDSTSQSTADSNGSGSQRQQEQDKKASDLASKRQAYIDDHPKPVEDRHGDSVKKHAMAAEKNQYKVRTGVFSEKKFDNHIQNREDNPADEFEEVDVEKREREGKKGK